MRLAVPVLFVVALAATVDARFADTQGFSGKHGVTCVSCHFPEVVELGTAVTVAIDGLPAAWDWSTSYPFVVSVVGGPPGNPAPETPQAGFDLEIDLGTLSGGAGMDGRLRFPSEQEATYTGIGTFLRSWNLVWATPNPNRPPGNATFWVAVIAANGNHIMNGPDVTGERGDRAAASVVAVTPSAAAMHSWETQPLPAPTLQPYAPPRDGGPSVLLGVVPDFADGAEIRIDDGEWKGATGSPGFSFPLPSWSPGPHLIEARSVWQARVSDVVSVAFFVEGGPSSRPAGADTEAGSGLWVFLLLLLALPLVPMLLKLKR